MSFLRGRSSGGDHSVLVAALTLGLLTLVLFVACAALPRPIGTAAPTHPGVPSRGQQAPADARGIDMPGGVPTSGTTFAGSQRVLVRSKSGILYLAYVKSVKGFDQVYVARSDDGGRHWSDYPQISAGATNSSNPDLVIDPKGRLRVFWTKHEPGTPTGASSTAGAAGGGQTAQGSRTAWGTASTGAEAQRATSKAADEAAAAKNGFVKPGQGTGGKEDEDYGTIRQLFMSSFNGRRWSRQVQLTHGDYNGFPSAAYDSRGVLHMVWYGYDGHNYQVIYSFLKHGRWSQPHQISQGYPDSVNPTIAVDGHDNLHVAWYKYSPATRSYQIYYREHLAAAARWTAADEQLSEGLQQAENVSMVVSPNGTVWAAWQGVPGGRRATSATSGIFVRSLKGGRWGPQERVSPSGQNAGEPSLSVSAAGEVFLLYQNNDDHQIYLARQSGGRWLEPVKLTSSGRNGYPNALWDGYFNPDENTLEFVWTRLDANPDNPLGKNQIRYDSIKLP